MQPPAWTRNSPGTAGCRPGPRLGGRTRQAAARDNVHPHRFGSAGSGPLRPDRRPVVHPLEPQVLYAAPGKQPVAVLPATELGGPTWVPAVQASPGWDRCCSRAAPTAPPGGSLPAAPSARGRRSGAARTSSDPDRRPQAQRGRWRQVAGDLDRGRGRCGNADTGRPDIPARVAGASRPRTARLSCRSDFIQRAFHLRRRTGDSRPARLARPDQHSAMRSATAACAYP